MNNEMVIIIELNDDKRSIMKIRNVIQYDYDDRFIRIKYRNHEAINIKWVSLSYIRMLQIFEEANI